MLKLALVVFHKEKDKPRFVVDIRDIQNFKPKTFGDFDPTKVFKVRWPLAKAKDSKSPDSSSYYEANILLIAASPQTLISLAKKKNIRLPRGYKEQQQKSTTTEEVGDVNVAKSSKRARRAVGLALVEKSSKEQRSKILQANISDIFTNLSKNSASKDEAVVNENKEEKECHQSQVGGLPELSLHQSYSVVRKIDFERIPGFSNPMKRLSDSIMDSCNSTPSKRLKSFTSTVKSLPSEQAFSKIDINKEKTQKSLSSEQQTDMRERTPVKECAQALDLTSKGSPASTVVCSPTPSQSESLVKSPLMRTDQRAFYITENGIDLVAEVHKAIEKRKPKESLVNVEEDCVLEESVAPKLDMLEKCEMDTPGKPLVVQFLEPACSIDVPTITSRNRPRYKKKFCDEDSDSSCSYVSSSSKLALLNERNVELQRKLNNERKSVQVLKTELNSAKTKLAKFKEILTEDAEGTAEGTAEYTPSKDKITWETSPLKTASPRVMTPSPFKRHHTPKHSSAGTKLVSKVQTKSSSGKKSISPKKSTKKKSTIKKSPKSKSKESGPYQDHRVIGQMIYDALVNKVPLQRNGAGKVHLGNNIWIKESSWTKLSTTNNPPLSTVKDLTEAVWGWEKCARYSITGGTGPKTPGAPPKEAVPRAGIQAILGFYRAKLMQQGLNVPDVLDNNVEKLGMQSIKDKLHYCHKKYVREMSKANDFADKNEKEDSKPEKDGSEDEA